MTARPFERPATLDEEALLHALRAVRRGDFGVRLPAGRAGMAGEIAEAFNDIVDLNQRTSTELRRIGRVVGRDGRFGDRASIGAASGAWAGLAEISSSLMKSSPASHNRETRTAVSSALRPTFGLMMEPTIGPCATPVSLRVPATPCRGI